MRSDRTIVTSRREFLSNAFGIALVSATTWPIRADQARSMQGQSNTDASKSGRTAQKTTLGWDVFLAPSIPAITSDGSCVRIALLGWDHGTSPATEVSAPFLVPPAKNSSRKRHLGAGRQFDARYALDAKTAIFRSAWRLLPALAAILIPARVLSKKSAMLSRFASELISPCFFALVSTCIRVRRSTCAASREIRVTSESR